jgi:hypothetical protein
MGKQQLLVLITILIITTTGYSGAMPRSDPASFAAENTSDLSPINQSGLLINNSDSDRYVVQVSLVPERIQKVNVTYENDTLNTYTISDGPVPLAGLISKPNVKSIAPDGPTFTLTTTIDAESRQYYDFEYSVPNASVLVTVSTKSGGERKFKTARILQCTDRDPRLQGISVNISFRGVSVGSRCT